MTVFAALMTVSAPRAATVAEALAKIRLPPGFAISLYADVPGARSLAVAPRLGMVFAGTRAKVVFAIIHSGEMGEMGAARVLPLIGGLDTPNGVAFHDGALYVAERRRILRFRVTRQSISAAISAAEVLRDGFPNRRHHGWRYIAVGPDRRLYIALGAPCNICAAPAPLGTIARMGLDGKDFEIFAHGVRNSVGMDFHPQSGEMFFTDNGADGMGDESPPDELNHAPRPGLHFGYPFFGGGAARTKAFAARTPPSGNRPPAIAFRAHVAPLGVHFYRGRMFPKEYRNDAFVAQHGSWNRSEPIGYRVMRVRFDAEGRARAKLPFAEGWLEANGGAWGRPVDIAELADGSLLVSDDAQGLIYRITYRQP